MKLHQEISQSFFISLDAIYANKMRAVLTTLGIIIGVVTVSLMNMAIDGVSNSFIRSISVLGSDTLYIEKNGWLDFQLEWWKRRGRRDITLRQSRKFMELMGNQFLISPYVSHQICTVEYNSEKISGVFMEGAIAESAIINNFEFSQGRFYDNNEVEGERPVCILGNDTVEALFKHESPIGKRVKINGINYEVIGTLKERGTFMGFSMDNVIYLPITRMLNDFARHPNVGISVQIKDLTQVDELTEEIRGAMRRVRQIPPGEPDDFAINKQEVLLRPLSFRWRNRSHEHHVCFRQRTHQGNWITKSHWSPPPHYSSSIPFRIYPYLPYRWVYRNSDRLLSLSHSQPLHSSLYLDQNHSLRFSNSRFRRCHLWLYSSMESRIYESCGRSA